MIGTFAIPIRRTDRVNRQRLWTQARQVNRGAGHRRCQKRLILFSLLHDEVAYYVRRYRRTKKEHLPKVDARSKTRIISTTMVRASELFFATRLPREDAILRLPLLLAPKSAASSFLLADWAYRGRYLAHDLGTRGGHRSYQSCKGAVLSDRFVKRSCPWGLGANLHGRHHVMCLDYFI